jgi:hypothetical protein
MKNQFTKFLALVIVLLLAWWILRLAFPPASQSELAGKGPVPTRKLPPVGNSSAKASEPLTKEQSDANLAQLAFDLMEKSNRPIQFYGKVIDQNGDPIPGVDVTFSIRVSKPPGPGLLPEDMFENPVVTTDPAGLFEITNTKGAMLMISSIEKTGYEAAKVDLSRSYWYWRPPGDEYLPNPNRPELFHMWRKAGAEYLIHGDHFYGIIPDGRSYTLDLLAQKKTENGLEGDIKVSISRPPSVTSGKKYDWSFSVDGIGGGLIETKDVQMYRAPDSGYSPRYEESIPANSGNWSDNVTRKFYVKSRNGQVFARLEVHVYANYQNQAAFSIDAYANPSGSENLEYDSRQNLTPQALSMEGQTLAPKVLQKTGPVGP